MNPIKKVKLYKINFDTFGPEHAPKCQEYSDIGTARKEMIPANLTDRSI